MNTNQISGSEKGGPHSNPRVTNLASKPWNSTLAKVYE